MFIMLRRRGYLFTSLIPTNYYYYCGCTRLMSATASTSVGGSAAASLPSYPSRDPFFYVRRLSSSSGAVSLRSSKIGAGFSCINMPTLRIKSCLSNNNVSSIIGNSNDNCENSLNTNGLHKARAYAPNVAQLQLLRCSEENDSSGGLNRGGSASHRGSNVGFLGKKADNIVVAVDVDEVLGNFVSALNKFIADCYSSNHSVSDYHVYEFFKIWNCSRSEADIRVHEFFKTSYFKSGIHPLPGALETLQKLSSFCDLSIFTSKCN